MQFFKKVADSKLRTAEKIVFAEMQDMQLPINISWKSFLCAVAEALSSSYGGAIADIKKIKNMHMPTSVL